MCFRSSILAQRACLTRNGSTGDLLHSALLKCSETYKVREYVNDGKLLISAVEPKVCCGFFNQILNSVT